MSQFKSSRRPQTQSRGVATPRLDTTTSSVGPLPDQKFHAEGYELDYFAEEDGGFESDEDKDVFAFERPVTAAARKMSDRVLQPSVLVRASQEDDIKDWQLVSPVDSGFGPKRSTSPSGVSVKPSLLTTTSSYDVTNTTDGGFTTDVAKDSDIYIAKTAGGKQAHRMRCFMRRDPLEAIPGSRDGVSRDTTELAGTTTVPDGFPTRGDGRGNLFPRWKTEVATERGVRCDEAEEEDSPYEEVRASVSNIDDPEMPALTWRVWFLGLFFLISRSALETVLQFRSPSASLPLLSIQLFVYPLGKLLAWLMPLKKYKLPRYLGGCSLDLNPGPFNIKENTLIIIMANIVVCPALQATTAGEIFLGADLHTGFMIFFVLGAQLAGMSLAGLGQRLLVEPASMIWPYNLVITTFLNTFHAEEDVQPGRMTRFRFFLIAFVGAFAYYFLPESRVVNQLFGVATGLGMGVLTFDWTQILYVGSPLMVPWWVQAHAIVGFVVFYWILCPIFYYSNVWYTAYMPMSTGGIMDRFGAPYNITSILNDTRVGCLNETAYHAYSPVYISVTFAMTLTLAFALATAAVVHTLLYHGPAIWRAIRSKQVAKPDIHAKLMRSYPTIPFWWFGGLWVIGFTLSIAGIQVFRTGCPVYMLLVSFLIPLVYFVPAGYLLATASQSLAINVMSQLLPGYIVPGNAVANMVDTTSPLSR
ncbi:hypothetical protein QFC21_005042 [Naganishia friedmannii]|uniref:Uncharacterized protein n=1 Tax=Naganishia friedmannii TaxID=89922 RepID=A0ACC2VBU6_9TREE|nr:hypothetical protein QFC21_005042 [Naganishia friedmannii]